MPDAEVYAINGDVPPGPGPIQTLEEYDRYWKEASQLLKDASEPGVPTADRIAMRDMAWQLIMATKQVVNNPALHAEVRAVIAARLEAQARAEGWIL